MGEVREDAAQAREELAGETVIAPERAGAASDPGFFSGYADEIEVDPEDTEPKPMTPESRRRMLWAIGALGLLGLTAVLPPLIHVNQYRREIVTSISTSLGRPVHLDSVTLNVLPVPGFTLTNFVVSEDPAYGAEPVIRADTVRVNLRLRSLWRRKVEFSRIELHDPSVNLVRGANGRWNIESILLQASRMPALPTAEKKAGDVQRFPYIEATGARVNLKQGLEKKPISLTDADFALWLPQPETWHLRLVGHPDRTDTAATDTGRFRMEGTLGKASRMEDVPVDLEAEWTAVPLGAASWVLMGKDGGMRGDMTLRTSVSGTAGRNVTRTHLELRGLRRADFVPAETLDVDVDCKAEAQGVFHRLEDVACSWLGQGDGNGLMVHGSVADTHSWRTADLEARWQGVPVSALMDAVRVASPRDSVEMHVSGSVSGTANCCTEGGAWPMVGNFAIAMATLSVGDTAVPVVDEDTGVSGTEAHGELDVAPIALNLGGLQPAMLTMQADEAGLRMRLSGMALRSRLLALAKALPQFGDGLEAALPEAAEPIAGEVTAAVPTKTEAKAAETPVRVDLVSARSWSGEQVWSPVVKVAVQRKRGRRR
jgi:AsmA protein